MQNKGLIRLFAIIFGIVCVYQLSFTQFTKNVESNAAEYAKSKGLDTKAATHKLEKAYLDSVSNKPVINIGIAKFTYNEVKNKAINLGLDLKGGINATLEVSVRDILYGLSNKSKNPIFNQALSNATKAQKTSTEDYISIFFKAFKDLSKGTIKLSNPKIFGNKSLRDKINFKMSDEEVEPVLRKEVDGSIMTAFQVLRSRIDKFGVSQPNIQRIGKSGRIIIELPGAKDIDRVKRLLQSTAELQFWEVYTNDQTANFFIAANSTLAKLLVLKDENKVKKPNADTKIDSLLGKVKDSINTKKANPLFTILRPLIPRTQNQISSVIASASVIDTAKINKYLSMPEIRVLLPENMKYVKFLWDAKPIKNTQVIDLYAIKSNREDKAPIDGDVIEDARQGFDQFGTKPEVNMSMNSRGTKLWAKMTTKNVGKFVAVVLDNYVYSAPRVNDAITGGRTSISGGSMTIDEAQDIANVLKAGKLPAPAQIIQSDIVGPSLGQEAIDSGLQSFILALLLVLLWMILYYGKAGLFADIALAANLLYIFGVLTGFGAVLTLPGIAGIVLTIGMSVDANVLIYERIKEELSLGKGIKEAVDKGFSGALSSILDANITTFLTGLILYIFGSGPIKGFATTLMIGIITSLFAAIFITRLIIEWYISIKGRKITFDTKITRNWFKRLDIKFLKNRGIAFIASGLLVLIGIISLATNGLDYGVDFKGGRTYTVRFEKNVKGSKITKNLKSVFGSAPEIKTFGGSNQLKITTKYKIDKNSLQADNDVQKTLFKGLKSFLPNGMTYAEFKTGSGNKKIGVMQAVKVGPTIADDIKKDAFWAILGSLIVVFLYILLRFRKWQYSFGAVIAVFHDTLVVIGLFSLLYKYLPFDLEIDQAFIAAILTVVGYSLNDTVIIFDRIREYNNQHVSWAFTEIIDRALSSTLSRTLNTSLTTLVVLLAIFIDGGETIRGFMFALIVGVVVGTYSSLFIASPLMYITTKKDLRKGTKKID